MRPLRGVRSNIQPRDFFLDHCTDENVVIIYEDCLLPTIERLEEELEASDREYEHLQESEGNARDLLEQIYHNYASFRNCKDLKKFIDSAFEDSYVEL